jgi:hypothetical protein
MAYAGATAILATAAKHDEHGTCIYTLVRMEILGYE